MEIVSQTKNIRKSFNRENFIFSILIIIIIISNYYYYYYCFQKLEGVL